MKESYAWMRRYLIWWKQPHFLTLWAPQTLLQSIPFIAQTARALCHNSFPSWMTSQGCTGCDSCNESLVDDVPDDDDQVTSAESHSSSVEEASTSSSTRRETRHGQHAGRQRGLSRWSTHLRTGRGGRIRQTGLYLTFIPGGAKKIQENGFRFHRAWWVSVFEGTRSTGQSFRQITIRDFYSLFWWPTTRALGFLYINAYAQLKKYQKPAIYKRFQL